MDQDDIRRRYEALPPLPETGWDFAWIDRVRTWEAFRDRGLDVSIGLRQLMATAPDYGEVRALAPELHDLLMEAYPLTPEIRAELDEWISEFEFLE